MYRSIWAAKPGQERILGVRLTCAGWERALSQAVLTSPEPIVHGSNWNAAIANASVHAQLDSDRPLHGSTLNHDSIQVGISLR